MDIYRTIPVFIVDADGGPIGEAARACMAPPVNAATGTNWVQQLGMPAAAGGIAVCFSHPLELTKVRLQLDNEKAAQGTPRMYKGWVDCVMQNFRKDGIAGLQRGLSLGITREVCFNAIRIGLLEPMIEVVHTCSVSFGLVEATSAPTAPERLAAGLACGALGGCCVNPIEVLKTRFQAFGGLTGFQHSYQGPISALIDLVRTEGLGGCMRGVATSTVRGILGPGSQVFAYGELKGAMVERGANGGAASTHVTAALGSGGCRAAQTTDELPYIDELPRLCPYNPPCLLSLVHRLRLLRWQRL